jgi:2-polyprenyl-6-methoxyphenol hydroxylase-like FAD-dependent oxidoreductase
MSRNGRTLVIVGAGPIGTTAALLLRPQFERIVILERQSRDRFLNARGFTFPIVFSPAAIRVLERVGAWQRIAQERSPFFGVVIHKRVARREFTWTAKQAGVFSHWRNHIISSLYERLDAVDIQVHFDSELRHIDFEANTCFEARLGTIPFDLALGADGIGSQTRGLLSAAHPGFDASDFTSILLDRWYAYRLPAESRLAERYLGAADGHASNVYLDNPTAHPEHRFRVVTTGMRQPHDEISVVAKIGLDVGLDCAKEINHRFFGGLVDPERLDRAWDAGVAGTYEHLEAPTFVLGSAVLVGDAAHGLESTGDLINIGLTSLSSLAEILARSERVPDALTEYDQTVGRALRAYAEQALRRSREKLALEVALFEAGALLGVSRHHPSLWGIYEPDFEICSYMQRYERDRRLLTGLSTGLAATIGSGAVARWARRFTVRGS